MRGGETRRSNFSRIFPYEKSCITKWRDRIKRSEGERRTGIYDYYGSGLHRLKMLHDIADTKPRRRLAVWKRPWGDLILMSLHPRPHDHPVTFAYLFVMRGR
jgi:hypothetical protein